MTTTVSHLLCQGLINAGVDKLYCLPGVQNDDFFNVLVDHTALEPVVARHEQACSYMATGAALASGRPQAYCTVPGQGVLNAAAGHSTAFATSARVFALLGQNKSDFIGRMHGQLHELPNQMAVVDQLSKHAVGLRDSATAGDAVAQAMHAFQSGHPAPVTVECPLDLWLAQADQPEVSEPTFPGVDPDAINQAAELLAASKTPIICLGGGAHDAPEAISEIAGMLGAPVSALRQGKGAYDERGEWYACSPVAHQFWRSADVVLGIGTRFMWHEMVWGADDDLKLIQINADPDEVNRRGQITVPINAMAEHALPLLIDTLGRRLGKREDRRDQIAEMNNAFRQELRENLQPQDAELRVIREVLGEDGIFVDDLTQVAYSARYAFPVYKPRGYVCAGYAGTLGWGVPAGIGAKLAMPDRRVLVVQGDGGFLYGAAELATAVKYNVPVVVLVYNDSAYGNVKRIQEQRFGHNRTIASDLVNPDIVQFADSFGCFAIRAEKSAEGLRVALDAAFAAGGPAVVEMPVEEIYASPWKHIFLPTVRGPKLPPLLSVD
ncbi:MAG: thiamine pyrophosphate-dependent enzyme [Pseudomonadota bacterium]